MGRASATAERPPGKIGKRPVTSRNNAVEWRNEYGSNKSAGIYHVVSTGKKSCCVDAHLLDRYERNLSCDERRLCISQSCPYGCRFFYNGCGWGKMGNGFWKPGI